MKFPSFSIELPDWITPLLPPEDYRFSGDEEKMNFVISLARTNIRKKTGGPFAAAIFNADTHQLIAPGINMVTHVNSSIFHAEMVAFLFAQQKMKHFDLGDAGMPTCELITSTQPCAMCYGGVLWSGVRRMVCGARDDDARSIGFDEGPKSATWQTDLEARGIRVVRDVCREASAAVLQAYKDGGGPIYNSRDQA